MERVVHDFHPLTSFTNVIVARTLTLFCDGASRGNPGPAGAGAVLFDERGREVAAVKRSVGRATNNVAEYKALLLGLEHTLRLGVRHVVVRADSELMIRQLRGEYRVKNPALRELHRRAMAMLARFESWSAEHVRREENSRADALANEAIDGAR